MATLDKTASVLHDLKNHNAKRNTELMVDNQTRELHHWNMNNLKGLKQVSIHGNYVSIHGNYVSVHGNYVSIHGNYTTGT